MVVRWFGAAAVVIFARERCKCAGLVWFLMGPEELVEANPFAMRSWESDWSEKRLVLRAVVWRVGSTGEKMGRGREIGEMKSSGGLWARIGGNFAQPNVSSSRRILIVSLFAEAV